MVSRVSKANGNTGLAVVSKGKLVEMIDRVNLATETDFTRLIDRVSMCAPVLSRLATLHSFLIISSKSDKL